MGRSAMLREFNRHRTGFTLVELVVVLVVVVILLFVLIWPNMTAMRERAQRVNCLNNLNQMWKAISAWGLSPEDAGAGTNWMGAFRELPEEVFICPEAGRLCKIKPDTNSYYQYYSGRRDSDGDKVILSDMNGPNQIAGPNGWGGNHGGRGGNVVKVAGSGMWVDVPHSSKTSGITNQGVFSGLSVNNRITVWPVNKASSAAE